MPIPAGKSETSTEWFKWMVVEHYGYVRRNFLSIAQVAETERHIDEWKLSKGKDQPGDREAKERATFIWVTYITKGGEKCDDRLRQKIVKAYSIYKAKMEKC